MIRFFKYASALAILSVLVVGLVLVSAASAADLDFNVASGNFNVAGNWIDTTAALPVPAAAAPTLGDNAFVRNGGTVTINSDVGATQIRIGASHSITNPDYDNSGVVDASDYVLWRIGGPLQNDATPADVGPDDYTLWRNRFGASPTVQNIGGPGSLVWTNGEIIGVEDTALHTGGPDIRVGRHVNIDATHPVEYDFPGTVVQNGANSKILLREPDSKISIGDDGTTPNPTNSYTLMAGTIGVAIGGSGIRGTNKDDGINVRNGSFTMTGGQIIDATPDDLRAGTLTVQRFMTVSSAAGVAGSENYGSATFTGGTVDVLGGIRVATGTNSRGTLTINGPVTITTGGDSSVGYNATNGVGVMNMSAGTFNVGRTYTDPVSGAVNPLLGRFQVGHRGTGTLNMSGGTINVTREVRVGAESAAGGSAINMTGGAITTPALDVGVVSSNPYLATYTGASIILDGPTATFTHSGPSTAIIGDQGKGLFEVRQGTALLGGGGSTIQVANTANSQATINVKGGKLTLGGPLNRTNLTVTPVIGLTGGTLEFNNTTTTAPQAFQANLTNAGSKLVIKQNAVQQVQVGSSTPPIPANFAMTSGSWDIEIGSHAVTGADWFNVPNGTASLTGGTLNISYLSGYGPTAGDVFNIITSNSAPTLGAVAIAGSGSPNWSLQTLGNVIQLKWNGAGAGLGAQSATVPEPTSLALLAFAAAGLLGAKRTRYGNSA